MRIRHPLRPRPLSRECCLLLQRLGWVDSYPHAVYVQEVDRGLRTDYWYVDRKDLDPYPVLIASVEEAMLYLADAYEVRFTLNVSMTPQEKTESLTAEMETLIFVGDPLVVIAQILKEIFHLSKVPIPYGEWTN